MEEKAKRESVHYRSRTILTIVPDENATISCFVVFVRYRQSIRHSGGAPDEILLAMRTSLSQMATLLSWKHEWLSVRS